MDPLALFPIFIILLVAFLAAGPSAFVSVRRSHLKTLTKETEDLRKRVSHQEQADQHKVNQYAAALEETALRFADKPKEEREALLANIKRHRMNRNA